MDDEFEIDTHYDGITVWVTNWKGRRSVAADFDDGMPKLQMAKEIYELLASANCKVKFSEEK